MAKTITQQQLTGSQGESFVSEKAKAMGFMYSSYGPPEAGIDGLLEIRDPTTGTATGNLVAVQVKTTENGQYSRETDASFEYLLGHEDVEYWRGCNLPVIVVLVHLDRQEAYWKSTESGTSPNSRRLKINKRADSFDLGARDAIAALCVDKGGFGVWFPPLRSNENGQLNLLRIVLPKSIFVAASPFKTGRKALAELLKNEERPSDNWVIRGGQFMSFQDPSGGALSEIIDMGSIERIDTEELAFPDDNADEWTFIELLRRTLGTQLDGILTYNKSQKAYCFPATPDTIEQTYRYKSLKVFTSADVVKKYEKDGKLKYVRHHAFESRFWRIGDEWYLAISPTFVFTWDGFRPDRYASTRLAGKKQREHNSSVLGQFVMWRHLLTGLGMMEEGLLLPDIDDDGKTHFLRFEPMENLDLPRGIPDELWRSTEIKSAEDDQQRSFAL